MRFTIDRFEGDFALVELENGEILDFPRKVLPEEAKEGDIIIISIDEEKTDERKKTIEAKFRSLFSDE